MTDTGLADPALAASLEEWRRSPTPQTRARVLAALGTARLFAAVTARSTAEHLDRGTGLRAESSAEMALVTLAGDQGRGIPVFLDVPAVTGFADGARPVPLTAPQVCRAALDDGAVAVLVDPPGAGFVVAGDELSELAVGRIPVPGTRLSTRTSRSELTEPAQVDPRLLAALAEALRGEPVRAARLLQGPDGLVLGVVPDGGLGPAGLAALAARLAPRLDQPLDLAVVAPEGPGVPLRPQGSRPARGWLRRGR